ncbi:uncharacterized protein LOC114573556 [Perca flavescens]|uniref:uncharacterized protein LOC114573556 n=1 Tax=Perca flavescens TaxID=8167 RepID=UPI00106EA09D|nr:uncharacterized protein LOC114573556 [Perca flavescens]
MAARVFSTSLTCLPKFTSANVVKSVEIHSSTKGNKLDKGYKFFHEEFIHNYQVSNILQRQVVVRGRCFRSMRKSEEPHKLEISLAAENANLNAFSCSCAAGKGFCNHIVAILYQTAHYSQLGLQAVPPPLACTSGLQRWHRPRTQGIHPEPVSELVVQKPKTVGKNGLRSTLYKAYTEQESAALQMIRGSTKQTAAMKRGLLVEPEVLTNYAELM